MKDAYDGIQEDLQNIMEKVGEAKKGYCMNQLIRTIEKVGAKKEKEELESMILSSWERNEKLGKENQTLENEKRVLTKELFSVGQNIIELYGQKHIFIDPNKKIRMMGQSVQKWLGYGKEDYGWMNINIDDLLYDEKDKFLFDLGLFMKDKAGKEEKGKLLKFKRTNGKEFHYHINFDNRFSRLGTAIIFESKKGLFEKGNKVVFYKGNEDDFLEELSIYQDFKKKLFIDMNRATSLGSDMLKRLSLFVTERNVGKTLLANVARDSYETLAKYGVSEDDMSKP